MSEIFQLFTISVCDAVLLLKYNSLTVSTVVYDFKADKMEAPAADVCHRTIGLSELRRTIYECSAYVTIKFAFS